MESARAEDALVTIEQFVAIMGAAAALLGVLLQIYRQLRVTHQLVNSRMSEMLELAKLAAGKAGEMRGRDFAGPATPELTGILHVTSASEPPDG